MQLWTGGRAPIEMQAVETWRREPSLGLSEANETPSTETSSNEADETDET